MADEITFQNAPPREPWEFGEELLVRFRRLAELRYSLFFEFPGDPGSWLVEDQYLLGTDLLVAPLFEDVSERRVYLPPGRWHRFAEDEGTAFDAQHTGELDWDGAREWRPSG
jgi:alpha-D-xyloside xylohydrolase